MAYKRRKSYSKCPEPLNSMIDIASAMTMGAIVKHKIKKDYERGQGDESLAAATMLFSHGAMRRGGEGLISLGGLYGAKSALKDIERNQRISLNHMPSVNQRPALIDDGITFKPYTPNNNRYAWRLNCEDGSKYGIYPENFEARDQYKTALRVAKESNDNYFEQVETEGVVNIEVLLADIDNKEEFFFCKISRLDNGDNIYYLADDSNFHIGEVVLLQGDTEGEILKGVVLSVERHTSITAPDNPNLVKKIIGRP